MLAWSRRWTTSSLLALAARWRAEKPCIVKYINCHSFFIMLFQLHRLVMLECRRDEGGSESSQVKDPTKLPCEIYLLDQGTTISKKSQIYFSCTWMWLPLLCPTPTPMDNRCSYRIDKACIYGQKVAKYYCKIDVPPRYRGLEQFPQQQKERGFLCILFLWSSQTRKNCLKDVLLYRPSHWPVVTTWDWPLFIINVLISWKPFRVFVCRAKFIIRNRDGISVSM